MIYPQTGLSLILCPAQNHEIITQDQMEVMSSLRSNGPWLTVLVLNGVGVVSNDSVSVYINAAAVFEDSTLYRSQCLQLSEKETPETHHWRLEEFFFF